MKANVKRGWVAGAVVLVLMAWAAAPAGAQQSERVQAVCVECHRNAPAASRQLKGPHGTEATCLSCHHALSPTAGSVAQNDAVCARCHTSVQPAHAGVKEDAPGCSSCHSIHDAGGARAAERTSAQCRSCHEAPHALHAAAGAKAPLCTDCHQAHAAQPARVASAAVDARCVSCHEQAHPAHPLKSSTPGCTTCHTLSAHSASLTGAELAGTCTSCHTAAKSAHGTTAAGPAPLCTDCHSFNDDPPLAQASAVISPRCGACHEDALAKYQGGGHAAGLTTAAGEVPNCVTCHGEHGQHALLEPRLAATIRCIECHSNELLAEKYAMSSNVAASYTDDFHGATVQLLGRHPKVGEATTVMVCSDCHGAHQVGWDGTTQLADVCLSCHEQGDARLAGAWLGHAEVGPDHQPHIWLVRLFYFFTIPFVLGGLALNILFHYLAERRRGARMLETHGVHRLRKRLRGEKHDEPTVVRFRVVERLEHFGSMMTFILLVVTGLPQTRPDWPLFHTLIGWMGGIGTTRIIHRVVGVMFVALLLVHVTRAVLNALRTRRMPVMVPSRQDFIDTLATLRHFLQGTPRPKVGKFDFAEKFEYWGLFLGGILMSVTGAILLFPELVSRLLPGELVAMFRVMHGLEATFAVLVVVLWHSWGVILRPEVFPLDTTIFTGKMSVERLKEEHALEYERLFPEEAPAAEEPPAEWKKEGAVA